ncbi:MAG TPA: malonyl-ACP O-methyltransferase BioC [Acidiferrobacter sp.]|nr:malonyl-ACP O-methyltransferase BioC [Acidiferrobacter sp.]
MSELSRAAIRLAFDRAARTYDESAVLQRTVADELIDRFQWLAVEPRVILDVGTGTGYALPRLRKRFRKSRIIGCDIAPLMVREAKRHRGLWCPSALFAADGERLPLASQSVDCVYSSLSLQWMDLDRAFAEFLRVLRPGGVLTFSTFGPDTLQELRAAWAGVDRRPHVHPFADMHDVGDALIRAGFADPVLDVERFTLTYDTATEALHDLKRIGARNAFKGRFMGLTGKARYQQFIKAYDQYRCDGRLPMTYEVVYGQAWCPAVPAARSGEISIPAAALRRPR